MNTDEHGLDAVCEAVIGAAFQVSNTLGAGFLEKVYENALAHELRKSGLPVAQQYPIKVMYDGVVAGEYVADLLVAGSILVELKCVKAIEDIHLAQCINYLRATGLRRGLILNFQFPKVGIKRVSL
ncbi:GxxExxY protein [Geothrix sp. PMB-07]|uniref:GxxExxY protein n=1 Tax=Geothrix sp. PMB-07 TaxID=3068640 RepID=UPI0027412EAE|nr:GxxExxY protein [Geothrix sp. PMB-07]WLT30301.1 GxxExxY protein [Geothrix sp. PMB-07]